MSVGNFACKMPGRLGLRCWLRLGFLLLLCLSVSLLIYLLKLNLSVSKGKHRRKEDGDGQITSQLNYTMPIPGPGDLEKLTHKQMAELYHRYINQPQVLCRRILRMGKLDDGGWDVCDDENYRPNPPCLVYSVGIGYDFSFDDDVQQHYGCEVHSFDPSVTTTEGKRGKNSWFHKVGLADKTEKLRNGWSVYTLQKLKEKLGHDKKRIDILKVDIEEWEWEALPEMLDSRVLELVDQLVIELHISIGPEPMRIKYFLGLTVLYRLYHAGFRIYFSHRNLWCKFLSKFENIDEVGCHEVSFIRIRSTP